MTLLLSHVSYVITTNGVLTDADIHIQGGNITKIQAGGTGQKDRKNVPESTSSPENPGYDKVIDGRGYCALAGFKNAHTHSAMTLLRGYGDDMRLQEWLERRIWPIEAVLSEDDIYWGTRLAALEMIKSGTTFANDMYFHFPAARQAYLDAGIRAAVGLALFDFGDPQRRLDVQREVAQFIESYPDQDGVFATIAPHSIYTCSPELLHWSARRASEKGLVYHIHMSETELEVENCLKEHGLRPWQWLEKIGVLEHVAGRAIAAHGIWLDESEMEIVQRYNITLAHNPASNMKLASGAFDWAAIRARKIPVMLAPDGVASNNNLDMFDEMKLAALLQKFHFNDPTRLTAGEALQLATGGYSDVFKDWGVGGPLQDGAPGDIALIDLNHPQMTPIHNIESNLAYAANGTMVDTVICRGKVLMEGRSVRDEEEILLQGRNHAEVLRRQVS